MSWIQRVFLSSVARKFWMGLTGIGLCGFIAFHLIANLLFFIGPDTLNGFSAALEEIPMLPVIEIGLYSLFALHILLGVILWFDNQRARAGRYQVSGTKKGGIETTISKTMIYSGVIVLVYTLLHVAVFRYAETGHNVLGQKDLYAKNIEIFSNGFYALWYVFGVCILAFHVSHGFQSAFRSLGVSHPVYTPVIEWGSRLVAVIVGVGFGVIPIYVFLFMRGA